MSITARRLAAAAIAAAGLIHLLLAYEYLEEKPYLGVLFVISVPLCAWVAARLWRRNDSTAWTLVAVVALGMAVGFVLSRTVGLPDFHEEEWEASGIASLVVELGFVLLAAWAMTAPRSGRLGEASGARMGVR
jgi:FtsH-binding integral membrane protein